MGILQSSSQNIVVGGKQGSTTALERHRERRELSDCDSAEVNIPEVARVANKVR